MRRRTLLAGFSGALGTVTAGCMSTNDPVGDASTPTDDDTSTPTDGDTKTPTDGEGSADPTLTGTSETDALVALEDVSCPSFSEAADRTVCSTTADTDSAPVLLEPEQSPIFELITDGDAADMFALTLRNQSDSAFSFNPYGWALKRHTDTGWVHVAPDATPEPMEMLEPGGTYTYEVAVEFSESSQGGPDHRIQHGFENGVYALVVDGFFERDGSGGHVECVGIFRVEQTED
ncbi:MAG: hypothetical protein V5A34_02665 [Halapricum sp.]